MALVKCPHCNGVVSDKAVKCPHCGCSLSKSTIIQHCGCPAAEDVNVSASKGEAKEQKEENRNLPSEDKLESNDRSNKTFVIVLVVVVAVAVAVAVGFSLLFAPLPVSTGVYSAPSGTADSDSTMVVTDCTSADSTVLVDATDETSKNESTEDASKNKLIGNYVLVLGSGFLSTWHLSIKEDGSCTLYEESDPKGIWHGAWNEYSDSYGIMWSSCDNPGEHNLPFVSEFNFIDKDIHYFYATETAMKAKDPNVRIEMKR